MSKKTLTTLTGPAVMSLLCLGTALGFSNRAPIFDPATLRMVEIAFVVDNQSFLKPSSLEFSVKEDKHQRREIKILPMGEEMLGLGIAEFVAPEGELNLVVCGKVKCSFSAEEEVMCGESKVPTQIAVDKIHQINFSTNFACQGNTASDIDGTLAQSQNR